MRHLRGLTASLALLAWPHVAAADAPAPTASPPLTPAPAPLAITVQAPRRLTLGRHGFRGKIKVTLQNRSDRPLVLHHGEENHLVFEGQDGSLHVICHSCACVRGSAEGRGDLGPFSVPLRPGEKRTLLFRDWGCGGGAWPGPPPGRYRLTYRVFRERRRAPAHPRACCAALREPAFWAGAVVSAPVRITVRGKAAR